MPGFGALGAIRDKATRVFSGNINYEEFEMPSKLGYSKSEDEKGFATAEGDLGTPESLPEPERPPLRHIDKYIRPECPCLSKRYTVAVLTCVGFVISFGMRCNMGMAKLQHQNKTSVFHWSVAVESAVDSSFFWGYLITQVPGGFLASMYPANRIFGTAIAISSFFNLLVPGATSLSPTLVIIVRVCQGFVEGVTYPACHGIWRFWAPPLERSRLATLAFCGSYAGVVLGMPLSGLLTGGISWQAPFYFYGVSGIIWYLVWLWLTFEKPAKHPTISARELMYIEQSLGQSTQVAMPTLRSTPWRSFFTSMPVIAIIVANFCRSWNFYLLVLFQGQYLHSTFDLKIEETGFVGALPHLLMTVIVPLGGLLADHVRKKGILTTTNVRKLFNCGGFGMEAIFFLVVAYSKTAVTATAALTMGVAFSGFAISGFNVNHLDIAPRYASILMGMSNGIGTIAGLICPIVIDNITQDHTRESWKVVFIMAATVHLIGVTFYGVFASGELQPWAEPTTEEKKKVWNPLEEAFQGEQPKTGEGLQGQQTQLNSHAPTYGSVEQTSVTGQQPAVYPSTNPFINHAQQQPTNPFINHIEAVQPETKDGYYKYGTVDDGARRCVAAYGVLGVTEVIPRSLRVAFCAVCGWRSHTAQKATRRLRGITSVTPRTPYAATHLRAPEDEHVNV